jgi:hypothetical protein
LGNNPKNLSFEVNTRKEWLMNPQRIIGIVLLVLGVGLLVVGINSSHSLADHVSNTFLGHFTQTTTWYILGGIASGILGLLMTLMGPSGRNA